MFRKFRLFVLLFILASVALASWRGAARLSAWHDTVEVAIYPVAGDASPVSAQYLAGLQRDAYDEIARWLQRETRRYGRDLLQPVNLRVAPPLAEAPPLPPSPAGVLDAVGWSLRLRWWAGRHDAIAGPRPHVRLFVLFHDPQQQAVLPHSTGLSKGGIGVIHVFASPAQHASNQVVIAHELLHIFGASDKYDPATLQPRYPDGYAEPGRQPRLPQAYGEIMAGRLPVADGPPAMPERLGEMLIGPLTAREIGLAGAP